MTILAKTKTHLVEYERGHGGLLTITRADGKCVGMAGKRICGDFKDCLKTHTPQQVTDCYLRMANSMGIEWEPLYKSSAMLRLLAQ